MRPLVLREPDKNTMRILRVFATGLMGTIWACTGQGVGLPDVPFDEGPGSSGVRLPSGLDEYGGFLDIPLGPKGGPFGVAQTKGRWWLRTPSGHAFFASATARVAFDGAVDPIRGYAPFERANRAWYGEDEAGRIAFYRDALSRLTRIGFATLGTGSEEAARFVAEGLLGPHPYVLSVSCLSPDRGIPVVNADGFLDVFHPQFASRCLDAVRESVAPAQRTDPFLIGVFADAGVRWFGEGRTGPDLGVSLADSFIALPPGTPGKDAFVHFLFEEQGYTLQTLGDAWGRSFSSREEVAALREIPDDPAHPAVARDKAAFVGRVAKVYFDAISAAIQSVVPGVPFLCAPLDGLAPDEVLRAMSVCDVVCVREPDPLDDLGSVGRFGEEAVARWRRIAREAGHGEPKPLWFLLPGVQVRDLRLPEPSGGIAVVENEAERGQWVREVVKRLLSVEVDGRALVVGIEIGTLADAPWQTSGLLALHGSPYLLYETGIAAAWLYAVDRLLGGAAPILEAPTNLRVEPGPPLRLAWDPVPHATAYEVLLAQDPAFHGVVARSEWGGARVDGPHDARWVVTEPLTDLDRPLSAGRWYASVSALAEGRAIASVFTAPVAFNAPRSCPQEHGTEAVIGCLERSLPDGAGFHSLLSVTTLFFDALGVTVPDAVFVVPERADDPASREVLLIREYPEPVEGPAASDRFCPAPVIAADGQRTNAARFIRVRHVTPFGQVVVDRPLDPDGGVTPFSCAGPVPSTGGPIARKVYSLDWSNPLLPRDQRIEVQLH